MANICDNKFYFSCEKNGGSWIKKFKQIFEEELEGELTWGSNVDEENSDGVDVLLYEFDKNLSDADLY